MGCSWKTYGKCSCDDLSSSGFSARIQVEPHATPFASCGESLHVVHDRKQGSCRLTGVVALQPDFKGVKPTVHLVATSSSHAVFVLSSNHTFAWGYNNWRQLGQADVNIYTLTPVEILPLAGANIQQLALGEGHNLAVSSEKRIYSWGRNDKGQLGRRGDCVVGIVTSGLPVERHRAGLPDVYAGRFHSGAVVNSILYTWGWGLYGQLGHGDTDDQAEPKMVSALNGIGRILEGGSRYEDVASIACGAWHTIVLSVTGDVYAFGWNKYGQVKPRKDAMPAAVYSPVLVFDEEELSNAEAVQVAAGYRHSVVRFNGLRQPICVFGSLYSKDSGFQYSRPRFMNENSPSIIYCGRWCTHVADGTQAEAEAEGD